LAPRSERKQIALPVDRQRCTNEVLLWRSRSERKQIALPGPFLARASLAFFRAHFARLLLCSRRSPSIALASLAFFCARVARPPPPDLTRSHSDHQLEGRQLR
jgi:hypothetical protein